MNVWTFLLTWALSLFLPAAVLMRASSRCALETSMSPARRWMLLGAAFFFPWIVVATLGVASWWLAGHLLSSGA